MLASDASRKEAIRRLAGICEDRGYAGVNVDLEELGAQGFQELALFVERAWGPRAVRATIAAGLGGPIPAGATHALLRRGVF